MTLWKFAIKTEHSPYDEVVVDERLFVSLWDGNLGGEVCVASDLSGLDGLIAGLRSARKRIAARGYLLTRPLGPNEDRHAVRAGRLVALCGEAIEHWMLVLTPFSAAKVSCSRCRVVLGRKRG